MLARMGQLVHQRLDARLQGLAEANKGVYTRYADDLTFSFKSAEGVKLGRFRWWVDQVCQQEGFTVNQEKFRVIRDSQRQVVTGIVVNEAVRVPRELRRELRAIEVEDARAAARAGHEEHASAVAVVEAREVGFRPRGGEEEKEGDPHGPEATRLGGDSQYIRRA